MSTTKTLIVTDDAADARRYREALEKISALAKVTEARGPLEDLGVPDHMVKEGGWVPIHPKLKSGLWHAAKIADAALKNS